MPTQHLALEPPQHNQLSDQTRMQNYLDALTRTQYNFDLQQTLLHNLLQRNINSIYDAYFRELESLPPQTNINANGEYRHPDNVYDEDYRIRAANISTSLSDSLASANLQYSTNLTALALQYHVNLDEFNGLRAAHGITQNILNNYYRQEIIQNQNGGRGGKRKRKKSKTRNRKKTKMRKTNRRML
jgi:hypothetical protein